MDRMIHNNRAPGSYMDAFKFDDCIECGECLHSCKYMNLNLDDSIEGIRKLLQGVDCDPYLNQCVFCAQCNTDCPVEARPAALMLERLRDRRKARRDIPEFFAYYLHGLEKLGRTENYFTDIYLASDENTRKIIDQWAEPKQGPDILWCGCGNRINPKNIEYSKILADLPKFGGIGDCCGVNAAKTGLYDTARHITDNLITRLSQSSFKRLVVSCGSCQEHFSVLWPEYFGSKFPFELISLYEYIDERMNQGEFAVQRKIDMTVAFSDACYGHLFGEKYLSAIKRLCEAIGITTVPLEHRGENAACCGVAGFSRNLIADGVLDAMKLKAKDIADSGQDQVLNYCMGCHTLMSMIYPVKSHYLLDKVLWALGDDMMSSIYIPKTVREKAVMKFKDPARFMLPLL